MKGRTRCARHGGKSLRGIASPSFKTGRYSKCLPAQMLAQYHEFLTDPEHISLREEVAVIRARLVELFQMVQTGESGELWRSMGATYREMMKQRVAVDQARRSGDEEKQRAAEVEFWLVADQFGVLLQEGANQFALWQEIDQTWERLRRYADTEQRRELTSARIMTMEQSEAWVAAIMMAIKKRVNDNRVLSQINEDIDAILAGAEARYPVSAKPPPGHA